MDNYRWAAEEKIIASDPALPVPGSRTDHNPAIGDRKCEGSGKMIKIIKMKKLLTSSILEVLC